MNVDDERIADYYNEAGYSQTDYKKMTMPQRQKDEYIRKEQINRKQMMEKEQNSTSKSYSDLYSAYPQERVQTLSMQSTMTENEFSERDWTPQDSSYGAAFPFCGWVPKSKRQLIEKVLLGLAGFFVIYMIVNIAMLLTSDKDSSYQYYDNDNYKDDDLN